MNNITIVPPTHPLPTIVIGAVPNFDFFEREGVLCWKTGSDGSYQEIIGGGHGLCQPGELVNPVTATINVSYVG